MGTMGCALVTVARIEPIDIMGGECGGRLWVLWYAYSLLLKTRVQLLGSPRTAGCNFFNDKLSAFRAAFSSTRNFMASKHVNQHELDPRQDPLCIV